MNAPSTTTSEGVPRRPLFFLVGSLAVLVLAALLETDGQTVFLTLGPLTIDAPRLCLFRRVLGVECAGCGLTRSFVMLAEAEWSRAWAFNRMGPLLFFLLIVQIPYQAYAVLAHPDRWSISARVRRYLMNGLLGLLFLNWVVDLGAMFV